MTRLTIKDLARAESMYARTIESLRLYVDRVRNEDLSSPGASPPVAAVTVMDEMFGRGLPYHVAVTIAAIGVTELARSGWQG